ncbi:MAG TPA: hypothetical protein VG225_08910 [Terracidiphilus sp.]|jgi:hypothetical protein|nr:hypothetical protein [Terracidiphilus sp.]
MNWRKFTLWAAVGAVGVVAAIVIAVLVAHSHRWLPRTVYFQGAVLRQDADPRKQLPISAVAITATDGVTILSTESDASGYFTFKFKENVWPRQILQVTFQKPQYKPFVLTVPLNYSGSMKKLYVAELTPTAPQSQAVPGKKLSLVSNIRIRYTVNTESDENIASAVRTFEVGNQGNVPCNRQAPCSPDGNWKATVGSITLDAGNGNEFRNARASCIAGPCPFTRIDSSGFAHDARVITASALDWSDTATFLLEAEVFRQSINSSVRESYPVIFGRTLNFVLPASQEGVSIEADLDGTPMVFPLGPDLYLSWATCNARGSRDSASSTVYRCELNPGYRF